MYLNIRIQPCRQGDCLPLLPAEHPDASRWTAHCLASPLPRPMPELPVGTRLCHGSFETGAALFTVTGHIWLPTPPERLHAHARLCPLLTAETHIAPPPPDADVIKVHMLKKGYSLAWVTLSDKGSQGLRADESGPIIASMIEKELPLSFSQGFILPDSEAQLRALLTDLALTQGYDIICTTGGTGVAPRDITPQATMRVVDYALPGMSQAMLQASLAKTSRAMISRAVVGVLGQTLIVNLPGSRKAVKENLEAILPALGHTLEKLHDDPSDCGG